MSKPSKPLGRKAYGSIAHLPNSRMGPADKACHEGQARIATERARDSRDRVIVQEKLDGSCCAVAKDDNGLIVPLGRAGYRAETSPYEQHHLFADWVLSWWGMFDALLNPGERVVGEWLAQAHSTRYALDHDPFVAFDVMRGADRVLFDEFEPRVGGQLPIPAIASLGEPMAPQAAMDYLGVHGRHGAVDPIEGAVWRVERDGKVDFLVKWVRPDKADGVYLPEVSGGDPVWNWVPEREGVA